MRELREDTFFGNKDEDSHDHIDQVLSIVGLFNIPGASKDLVMLRVFPFTLTGSIKKDGVDRLARNYHYWVLLKRPFIQRYSHLPWTAKQLEIFITVKQKEMKSFIPSYGNSIYYDLLYKCTLPTDIIVQLKVGQPGMRHEEAKGKCSCNPGWMPNLRRALPRQGLSPQPGRPPGYYTKADNRPPYGDKRQILEELLAKHQEESARISTKMEIKQLAKEIHFDKILNSSSEQVKTVTSDQETSGLNKLLGVSFISGPGSNTPEVLQHQLPPKELNPGSFTLPYTIDMSKKAPLGIVENVLVEIDKFLFPADFVILDNTPSETTILGRPLLATIHAKIDVYAGKISLGINENRISFNTMRKDHNYAKFLEKKFLIQKLGGKYQDRLDSKSCGNFVESAVVTA
ncbi:putative reverse transcriptase domain-containing protein [Tanacetum coccineum]